MFLASVLVVYLLIHSLRVSWILRKRQRGVIAYGRKNDLLYGESGVGAKIIARLSDSSLSLLPKDGGVQFRNLLQSKDGYFADYEFGVYEHTKHYNYKARRKFYMVRSITLPRVLPNVLFDSKKSHKDQFRLEFDPKQKHSLEGNFDEYFDTFFPPQYTIDSLSFITPEVMQAMIAAQNYDIEINGDQLMLIGPISASAEQQLHEIDMLSRAICRALLNNIKTYRDTRLPYAEGRQSVAVVGRRLRPKKIPRWTLYVGIAVYLAYMVAAMVLSE